MWALITLITLSLISVGFCLAKHGELRGKYNFWLYLINEGITWWLLYEAGLFDKYL